MGLRPDLCPQTGVGRPTAVDRPVARGRLVVRKSSGFRRFGSRPVVSDVRSASVVRALESVGCPVSGGRPGAGSRRTSGGSGRPWIRLGSSGAGRPGWAGRPVAVASRSFFSWSLYLASSPAVPLDVVTSWLSSKYLIMHRTHVGGSSHVSHAESEGSERSEFTLCPMASS